MSTITVDRLKIYTQLPILHLLSFKGKIEQNQHGVCDFEFQLTDECEIKEFGSIFQESMIKVYELNAEEKTERPLFCGLINDIRFKKVGGVSTVTVKTVTSSMKLDRERKMRSFQNIEMTYHDVVKKVLEGYSDVNVIWCVDKDKKIDRPIIQYKETDWEFIIRLASHFHSGVWVDETKENIWLYIGVKENAGYEKIEDDFYECGINPRYYENEECRGNRSRERYVYFILKRYENRSVGDGVDFSQRQMVICRKEIGFDKGELLFYYIIGYRELLYEKTKYNRLFAGLQLEGEVKSVERELVKIHLLIDGDEEQEFFSYPWLPVTGNIFYCMPEVNSKVLLQFWGEDERNAVVKSVIRTNADVCSGYTDEQNRTFETLEKKTLKFFPEEIAVSSVKAGNMPEIALRDKAGIYFRIHEKFDVEADENIVIKAGKIYWSAPVGIVQCAAQSSMEIHQDFNLYSPEGLNHVQVDTKDIAIVERNEKRKYSSMPNLQMGYAALGAVPTFGSDMGEVTAFGMSAIAGIPMTGGGKTTVALTNAVNGIPYDTNAVMAIKVNVMNGGYPLPKCKKNFK